jgi:hypothetical protein
MNQDNQIIHAQSHTILFRLLLDMLMRRDSYCLPGKSLQIKEASFHIQIFDITLTLVFLKSVQSTYLGNNCGISVLIIF